MASDHSARSSRCGFAPEARRPRLCIIGPLVGGNPGYVTTQGEILRDLFEREGFPVISSSSSPNRFRRLAEILGTLIRYRCGIDVMLLQTFGGPSFVVEDIASRLGQRFGMHIVMVLHGGAMPEFVAQFPRWTNRVLRRADALVAPSAYLASVLGRHGYAVEVIPNVLRIEDYPYRHRRVLRPRLLWMRTFHPAYNPMMALRVLARLREAAPDATLVMAGQEKGLGRAIREHAQRLGVADALDLPGFLGPEAKAREGERADLFINTNKVDNMPVSVVEACAMGLPVVATDVGGLKDLLEDGRTGLLVPDDDDEAMARAIRRLLDEPDLASRLSSEGRRLAEACDWGAVRPRWDQLFARLEKPGPGRGITRRG